MVSALNGNHFLWAAYLHYRFDHFVKRLCLYVRRGLVIHFLAFAPACDQTTEAELAKVVGDRGSRHIAELCEILYVFFEVAEYPENADTAGIAHLLEDVCDYGKIFNILERFMYVRMKLVKPFFHVFVLTSPTICGYLIKCYHTTS